MRGVMKNNSILGVYAVSKCKNFLLCYISITAYKGRKAHDRLQGCRRDLLRGGTDSGFPNLPPTHFYLSTDIGQFENFAWSFPFYRNKMSLTKKAIFRGDTQEFSTGETRPSSPPCRGMPRKRKWRYFVNFDFFLNFFRPVFVSNW